MATIAYKCPKCGHRESVMSSRPSANDPPCPRCEKFTRMVIEPPPPPGQQSGWTSNPGQK